MKDIKSLIDVWNKVSFVLSKKHKWLAVIVLIMSLIAALLELLGVAVVLPILDMMLDMRAARDKWFVKAFADILNLNTDQKIVWYICLITIAIYLIKNLFFSLYSWMTAKYAYKVKRELSIRVLRAYMKQGYIFFVENNTSRLLEGIGNDIEGVYNIINVFFSIITKGLTIVCIGIYIVMQSKEMALVLGGLAAGCFLIIQLIYGKRMQKNGIIKRNLRFENSKISIEAIQGNKEILVTNKQEFFLKNYEKILAKLNRVSVKVDMGTIMPAYIIEMLCISGVMVAVAVQMGQSDNSYALLTQVSTIAVGAFRILPALGVITSGVNSIRMYTAPLNAAYDTLKDVQKLEEKGKERKEICSKYREKEFQNEIELRNISYRYPNTEEDVLTDVSLHVKKGMSVAFIGPSGAGKTTISDLILSLLKPTEGKILMDGIDIEDLGSAWNKIIGYVPQMVYIVDDDVRHNIAFGEDNKDIDDEKVWEALKMAQLDDMVRQLPAGLKTVVGERGIRFSGGQRQRLAIARALYRNPEILVLDEATAALDNETEKEVMKAIEGLKGTKTLIIVAHRLTTVQNCDEIYEVKGRKVQKRKKEEVL